MKINVGGLIENLNDVTISANNRAFTSGDSVKEVLRLVNGEIFDWENHYFNLMASMRIYRMNIPLSFTPEFFQEEIKKVSNANNFINGKIEFVCYRDFALDILKSEIKFLIKIENSNENWILKNADAEIEVYKDYTINSSYYSSINAPHPEEIIAEIFRLENEYEDLILLNKDKRIARTLKGSIFVLKDGIIKTPKFEEGVIKSVYRNYFIDKINKSEDYTLEEVEIFPFEIQKADEVFVLLDGEGILSITQNRKKVFQTKETQNIFERYILKN